MIYFFFFVVKNSTDLNHKLSLTLIFVIYAIIKQLQNNVDYLIIQSSNCLTCAVLFDSSRINKHIPSLATAQLRLSNNNLAKFLETYLAHRLTAAVIAIVMSWS